MKKNIQKNECFASSRLIQASPQKVGLVASLIRGKSAMRSAQLLMFSRRRVAESVMKVLQSAIANGENNKGLDAEKLVVSRVEVGKSITMKRWRPRARGRMGRYRRLWSSILIVLSEQPRPKASGESKAVVTNPAKEAKSAGTTSKATQATKATQARASGKAQKDSKEPKEAKTKEAKTKEEAPNGTKG